MKTLIILISTILFVCVNFSFALECMGCDISDPNEKCDFFYKCKKGVETCETVISKVNGNYSIAMSCASKENCGHDTVFNEGLEECQHKKWEIN